MDVSEGIGLYRFTHMFVDICHCKHGAHVLVSVIIFHIVEDYGCGANIRESQI